MRPSSCLFLLFVVSSAAAASASSKCLPAARCDSLPPPPHNTTYTGGVPSYIKPVTDDFAVFVKNITDGLPRNSTTAPLLDVYAAAQRLPALWAGVAAQYLAGLGVALKSTEAMLQFSTHDGPAALTNYTTATTPAEKTAINASVEQQLQYLNATESASTAQLKDVYHALENVASGDVGFGQCIRGVKGQASHCNSVLPADLKRLNASLVEAEIEKSNCAPSNTSCLRHWSTAIADVAKEMQIVYDGMYWCAAQNPTASKLLDFCTNLQFLPSLNLPNMAAFAYTMAEDANSQLQGLDFVDKPPFIATVFMKAVTADLQPSATQIWAFLTTGCENLCG